MTPTRCVGQANFFSTSSKSITSKNTSIIHKLTSRQLTAQGLQIHIHQHIGFLVHLVWYVNKPNIMVKRCLERGFTQYRDLHNFCKDLKDGAFEGLCNVVGTHFSEWINDKIKLCTVDDETHSLFQRAYILRRDVNNLKRDFFTCTCPVVLFCDTIKLNKASFLLVTLSFTCMLEFMPFYSYLLHATTQHLPPIPHPSHL